MGTPVWHAERFATAPSHCPLEEECIRTRALRPFRFFVAIQTLTGTDSHPPLVPLLERLDMDIRDRVIDFRRVPASSIRPSPFNWRTHPREQADALRGLLAELGFAGAVLAREPDIRIVGEAADGRDALAVHEDAIRPGQRVLAVDDLFSRQARSIDPAERKKLVHELQGRVLDQAYYMPGLWWTRRVVHLAKVKNYVAPPSHYTNQKLQDVWLSED